MSEEQEKNNEGESSNVKQMREQIERLQEQNETYASALRISAFKEAGLDPEKGVNKAIYRTYEGEIDPAKIAEFAKEEYGIDVTSDENAGGQNENTSGVPASQKRTQKTMQSGQHEDPPSALDKADEAASEGDWVTSAAMKDKELLNVAESRFSYSK